MKKLKSGIQLLIGLGFVGLGVFILMAGGDPSLGFMLILFFGSATAMGAIDLTPAETFAPDADGTVRIYASRLRASVFLLGSIAFAYSGVHFVFLAEFSASDWIWWIGLGGIVMGLVGMRYFLPAVLKPKLLYVITDQGLESHTGLKWTLKWAEISNIRVQELPSAVFLEIETFAHIPDPSGLLARVNRLFGRPPYAMTQSMSRVDFLELANHIGGRAQSHWEGRD